jgi:hypothetical protein
MISHCANPDCLAPFNGSGGRFFRFSAHCSPDGEALNSHGVQHFWLCQRCAGVYTLEHREGCLAVRVRPLLAEMEATNHSTCASRGPARHVIVQDSRGSNFKVTSADG